MNDRITYRTRAIGCLLFALLLGAASSAGAQVCTFRTSPGSIAFNNLDPSVATTQTAQTTARVRCTLAGSPTWQFSGAHGNAPLQMKHLTQNAFIPYTAAATYVSGPVNNQQWRITATVLGPNYQNGLVGSYSDILTVTITP